MVAISQTYPRAAPEVASSDVWLEYFRRNRERLLPLPWEDSYCLTDLEVSTVARSVQQFQLGESSEGKHLMALSYRFAARTGDEVFPVMMKLFIGEEQRHSGELGRFLQRQGLALLEADPVDGVFRLLRHLTSLELAVMAMLTAEIIAIPYYSSLKPFAPV